MNKVIYRDLVTSDYKIIKELIGEAFGFSDFIKDKELLDIVLSGYLQECILNSSFSKVAQKNGKVIGFILGNAKNDKNRIISSSNPLDIDMNSIESIISNKENHTLLEEFLKIQTTYKEIIKGKEDQFQGCIQLFVVSKESRGLGVGKTLVKYLSDYMKSMNVNSLYLFTDSRCNYGFYDSQNFNKLNEKQVSFDSVNAKLDIFLYGYRF
ncbi:GNAT family N-acetyltransferase [Terrisporobacter sp.]|uniref:GNAT family N-acetyltransferase n=1 Tax=Terrisporobacter sp. TaxID=1965305 RepID=UPI0026328AFC|nr:GNAT family N-acetyltransferase [Terrisporobacter sp.]